VWCVVYAVCFATKWAQIPKDSVHHKWTLKHTWYWSYTDYIQSSFLLAISPTADCKTTEKQFSHVPKHIRDIVTSSTKPTSFPWSLFSPLVVGRKTNGALSIRSIIMVWNFGYSIWQMERYFPVCWTNPSQAITFQVSSENTENTSFFCWSCSTTLKLNTAGS